MPMYSNGILQLLYVVYNNYNVYVYVYTSTQRQYPLRFLSKSVR